MNVNYIVVANNSVYKKVSLWFFDADLCIWILKKAICHLLKGTSTPLDEIPLAPRTEMRIVWFLKTEMTETSGTLLLTMSSYTYFQLLTTCVSISTKRSQAENADFKDEFQWESLCFLSFYNCYHGNWSEWHHPLLTSGSFLMKSNHSTFFSGYGCRHVGARHR